MAVQIMAAAPRTLQLLGKTPLRHADMLAGQGLSSPPEEVPDVQLEYVKVISELNGMNIWVAFFRIRNDSIF